MKLFQSLDGKYMYHLNNSQYQSRLELKINREKQKNKSGPRTNPCGTSAQSIQMDFSPILPHPYSVTSHSSRESHTPTHTHTTTTTHNLSVLYWLGYYVYISVACNNACKGC